MSLVGCNCDKFECRHPGRSDCRRPNFGVPETPMRADDLRSLRDRVLAATGPDGELDARIGAFLDGRTVEETTYLPTGAPCLVARNSKPPHDAYVIWVSNDPGYAQRIGATGSLDAVVALCERVLPDWFMAQMNEERSRIVYAGDRHEPTGRWVAALQHWRGGRWTEAKAATPALALLAALLAALVAEQESRSPSLAGG